MSFPIYSDENVRLQVVARLRRAGYDVISPRDVGLLGVLDEVRLTHAPEHGRVFVTHDLKTVPALLEQLWTSGREHSGVIFCDHRSPREMYEGLRILLERHGTEELQNITLWLP